MFLLGPWAVRAQSSSPVRFSVTVDGSYNVPRITLRNESRSVQITWFEMTIGKEDKNFDAAYYFNQPPSGSIDPIQPDLSDDGDDGNDSRPDRSNLVQFNVSGFDPGEELSFYVDVDPDSSNGSEDYRNVFFNNGGSGSVVTVRTSDGQSLSLTMNTNVSVFESYTFAAGPEQRQLTVRTVAEADGGDEYVKRVTVKIVGTSIVVTNFGETSIPVYDDETVEISAPQVVYKNIHGLDITDSVANEPRKIEQDAEERFIPLGMSVNNVPQTADPTFYRFNVSGDTLVVAKWQHDYALTVSPEFTHTASTELDATGKPWAGPLESPAEGRPDPAVKKSWVKRGESFIAQIDGALLDFSHPGLDVRFVPKAFRAYGPPRPGASPNDDLDRLGPTGVDIRVDARYLGTNGFPVGQSPPQRQQVGPFTMYGPGGIQYIWQIQYGVKVNVDDVSRIGLPKLYQRVGGTYQETAIGEGTFWFDPGVALRVATAANVSDANSQALTGWFNGDGFYFSANGEVNTIEGTLASGGPVVRGGSAVAAWLPSVPESLTRVYRGLDIPQLQRPARVQWQYGNQVAAVTVPIGEYVFQHDPVKAALFDTPPERIQRRRVTGTNPNVGDNDMAIWDPVAAKLYPLVPGDFTATWRPDPSAPAVEVRVTAVYPASAHYPHIARTPPVALDPDPNDDFVFKAVKYTENQAGVDDNGLFTVNTDGHTVLLFAELQRDGRGQPREFLRVRVVETKRFDQNGLEERDAIIGQKIQDPEVDLAEFGTGYVMSFADTTGVPDKTRYNPFIYDASKLSGIAAKDLYDLTRLRSDTAEKVVVHKERLPGPVIPVNLHPGWTSQDRLIVVWYDDPANHDGLLWPWKARHYHPQWPTSVAQGLGRIVMASQFGSESVDATGADQVVVPAIGNLPEETTYNPSRLQQVQVYVQNDPNLPGYNPNEEHALMAPSLRFADISPRPPAAYALRKGDLNSAAISLAEADQAAATYTSHPFVLVQFLDTADGEMKMRVYEIQKADPNNRAYQFANQSRVTPGSNGRVSASPRELTGEPHVTMIAGEPVIPFYPLGVVSGASPCPDNFGTNLLGQTVYWEDHKGTSWAVSGGSNAWFTAQFSYPMAPDFWWPPNESGFLVQDAQQVYHAFVPQAGDCVAFLPTNLSVLRSLPNDSVATVDQHFRNSTAPVKVLYKSDWPDNAPVLKAGETLTFQGGESRADHPTRVIVNEEGEAETVESLGLPGVVAFSVAEVVFDSLNPEAQVSQWASRWTARVAQVLDKRSVPLTLLNFPPELQPATKRTRVQQGKYIFTELPASLQERLRYDSLAGRLEMFGRLNNKEIGDQTLTAAPGAVYILEPNILTADEEKKIADLAGTTAWKNAVRDLAKLTRNPSLIDTDPASNTDSASRGLPSTVGSDDVSALTSFWTGYYQRIGTGSVGAAVPLPIPAADIDGGYLVGLEPKRLVDGTGRPITIDDPVFTGIRRPVTDPRQPVPTRAFGPGLALLPNADFLDPTQDYPEISWVTVVENNDESLVGSPITVHVIQVSREDRYRGAIKTVLSDNVFDENIVLRHQGDFGANAGELAFEWWYRPDDGSLHVPPPDLLPPGQPNPWKLFPDTTGKRGVGLYQITLKGNPNAPETLLADSWWFVRYRHTNDQVEGVNWNVEQTATGEDQVNFTWAGAGNSDPFNDFDADGIKDYRAQLAQGWIKRVLDAVNPYEARIRNFEGENPATISSMIAEFGQRFEGAVALNPDKDVIENVGLIELYETILKRGRDLSIDLSRPVATPAIANALQLASTRISDFYTLLGNEAYIDALDPTVGYGSEPPNDLSGVFPGYGSLAPAVFCFQNQMSSLIEEELALLRGVDDYFARPVYNRLFWNFTKGEGEAAYAITYNLSDVNWDGFVDEEDAAVLYPQGHGDAWGHYLTALRNTYELLKHENFNWVSRSEFYNLRDIVIKVDFLDERKFAQTAAAKAKAGAEIVNQTYRQKYVEDPSAQWQGYIDSNKDRSWGVDEWARRAGQGAYFDWIAANALLPSQHPNERLEGIQKVDRRANADIPVISANLNSIQTTLDQANKGHNPLGLAPGSLVFDIDSTFLEVGSTAQIGTRAVQGLQHFDQIYERALKMLQHAIAVFNNANLHHNLIRSVGNSEVEFRKAVFQEDLAYRNQLIKLFGKPYEGTIGPGKIYPAGYDGPDLLLFQYVDVRQINKDTVPGPTAGFAGFDANGALLDGGEIYEAFNDGLGGTSITNISNDLRQLFSVSFAQAANSTVPVLVRDGLYAVNYTDLTTPKVWLTNLTQLMPITAAGYSFQAPRDWGSRLAVGELQLQINRMLQQEAQIANAIGAWDALSSQIGRTIRLLNAKIETSDTIAQRNQDLLIAKTVTHTIITGFAGLVEVYEALQATVTLTSEGFTETVPKNLPTAGLAFSPGDALSALRGATVMTSIGIQGGISGLEAFTRIAKLIEELSLEIAQNVVELENDQDERALAKKEGLVELENLIGDEPVRRIDVFKEIQALRELSDEYRAMVDEGVRLIDERAAFNKRVAAQTQRQRYQDMTFRVARNHALQTYRAAFDLAARYAYLAAKAYDYETNFDPSDPGSPSAILADIVRARTLGQFVDGEPRMGAGGLAEALGRLKQNYEVLKAQFGINNPAIETGKASLRTEMFRILPQGESQPQGTNGFPEPGVDSDEVWRKTLQAAVVEDLWDVPEFRYYCRPFNSETDGRGSHVKEPGLVLRFGTQITAGKNMFGQPLSGGDHAYDPSHYATKIQSLGVWFSDYLSGSVLNDLPATPRLYLVPVGMDIMSVPSSSDPNVVRIWKVVDQQIPPPLPSVTAELDKSNWIPLLDALNGRLGEPRKFAAFRAYHDGGSEVNLDELTADTRLIARSVWNTQWALIIPGRMLNSDPKLGLQRFIDQVSDIRLVFRTYSLAGN